MHRSGLLASETFGQLAHRLRSIAREVVVDERQHRHALGQQLYRLGIRFNLVLAIDDDVVQLLRQAVYSLRSPSRRT